MKIPTWILSVVFAGFTAWLAWVSLSISDLKAGVSELHAQVSNLQHFSASIGQPPAKGQQ